MPRNVKQPTTLKRLEELINIAEGDQVLNTQEEIERCAEESCAWLQWAYNFLDARKTYHKKTYIKRAMLEKMARTLLSKDELDEIDRQAEETLGNLEAGSRVLALPQPTQLVPAESEGPDDGTDNAT